MDGSVDYFSMARPAERHLVAAPTCEPGADGVMRVRFFLLAQGKLEELAHLLSPRSEAVRLLLRKEESVGSQVPSGVPAPQQQRFTVTRGCRVVLAPCAQPRSSVFTQTVELLTVAPSRDEAVAFAKTLGHQALVCEVLRACDDRGGAVEWVRWDDGRLERPAVVG
jgi:hypothetical protein